MLCTARVTTGHQVIEDDGISHVQGRVYPVQLSLLHVGLRVIAATPVNALCILHAAHRGHCTIQDDHKRHACNETGTAKDADTVLPVYVTQRKLCC